MTTRTVPDLKELFKQASEIAQQVPPNMQEAAFNRALDLLTGSSGGSSDGAGNRSDSSPKGEKSASRAKSPLKPATKGAADQVSDRVGALLRALDSTQHPAVVSAPKTLDKALMVLKIALDEQSIDGLSSSDIARVLREKFRVSVAENAVRMALSRAATLVDRVKDGAGYNYRIMAPGNKYLADLNSGNAIEVGRPVARKTRKKATVQKVSSPPANSGKDAHAAHSKKEPAKGAAGARSGSNGLGPKAAVVALIDGGYFSSPKTGLAVQEYLQTKRGYRIGSAQLRLAMLRLVRERQLEREVSSDGDYEYTHK